MEFKKTLTSLPVLTSESSSLASENYGLEPGAKADPQTCYFLSAEAPPLIARTVLQDLRWLSLNPVCIFTHGPRQWSVVSYVAGMAPEEALPRPNTRVPIWDSIHSPHRKLPESSGFFVVISQRILVFCFFFSPLSTTGLCSRVGWITHHPFLTQPAHLHDRGWQS